MVISRVIRRVTILITHIRDCFGGSLLELIVSTKAPVLYGLVRVLRLGLWVLRLRFRAWVLGLRFRARVSGSGFRALDEGFGFWM